MVDLTYDSGSEDAFLGSNLSSDWSWHFRERGLAPISVTTNIEFFSLHILGAKMLRMQRSMITKTLNL